MITLAVETSTLTASCAILEDERVLAELSAQYGKTHSQKLVPMLRSILDLVHMKFSDIDLFAAATGPGSFTGLRIGVVTVKALAYALNKPVSGVPTLDALAACAPDFNGFISPMLDARNKQVYTALYRKNQDKLVPIEPSVGVHIDEWLEKLREYDKNIIFLGDAVPVNIECIRSALGDRASIAQTTLFYPRASSVGILAGRAFKESKPESAFELVPQYLRKSQAERLKERSLPEV